MTPAHSRRVVLCVSSSPSPFTVPTSPMHVDRHDSFSLCDLTTTPMHAVLGPELWLVALYMPACSQPWHAGEC